MDKGHKARDRRQGTGDKRDKGLLAKDGQGTRDKRTRINIPLPLLIYAFC